MASYDLVCDACGNEFEVFVQGFLKDDQKSCPKCGSSETHQKFSSFLSNLGGSSASSGCATAPRGSGFG